MARSAAQSRRRAPLQLTDQALVAVTLARGGSAPVPHPHVGPHLGPHLGDLLLGLAAEPDGVAGGLLREFPGALDALRHRAAPPLPTLNVALRWAVDGTHRPLATADLLAAAVEVGGSDLREALATVALPALVRRACEARRTDVGVSRETFGLGASAGGLEPAAELAVARTRAGADGALTLLVALAEAGEAFGHVADAAPLLARHARAVPSAPDREADVDAVLSAARTWRGGAPVSTADLVRATLVVGGRGPVTVLEELERYAAD